MLNRLFPRTIFGLAISFAVISAVVTLLLGVATMLFFHAELERQLDQRIEIETRALLDSYHEHGFAELVRAVGLRDRRVDSGNIGSLATFAHRAPTTGYILTDAQGRRRAGSFAADLPPPGWSEFVRFRRAGGGIGEAQAMNSPLAGGGHLVVAADRQLLFDMHRQLLWRFGAGYLALLALETLVMIGFGRLVRRRVLSIESTARVIMGGDLSRRMPLDGSGGEFDRLSIVLNRMLDRIGALLDNLRQISVDIAHDLRTPLHRLHTRLEDIEAGLDGSPLQPLAATAVQEMHEVLDLFSGLLAIAEVEGKSVQSRFAIFDLTQAVEDVVEAYALALEQAGMELEVVARPTELFGDRALLQRCVANLLDNVLVHTGAGTKIRIAIAREADRTILLFADTGPGIPDADHERVFRRLTRLDLSRSRPGHGLGMSMIAAIAAAHGGSVKIVPGAVGLTVRLSLKANGSR